MPIDQHLRQERAPRVPEQHERQLGALRANALGQLPQRVERRRNPAAPEVPEPLGAAVLADSRAPMAAVVVGVDDEARAGQCCRERAVAAGVFADTVKHLYDAANGGSGIRFINVINDVDAGGIAKRMLEGRAHDREHSGRHNGVGGFT